ncbi:MAG: SpoVR family protein [Candidatus Kapabacteria bacterium]|nr:SpoVR family protein [Candidatus Kapabacteria bacterium]
MYLIDQHTKSIMEECKSRARDAGLKFDKESLEYIVTNRDLIELSPKLMIPTLYDYWVNDVEVLKGKGIYKLYPNNPYETVINSRPAISYYNDNNPDWLNIMIFYHVIAHIDFFQNNIFFKHTWNDDFVGQALADKRLIDGLRSEYGRWVDYVIEFSRSIDNLVGYYDILSKTNLPINMGTSERVEFYFGEFLQEIHKVPEMLLFKDIEKYNSLIMEQGSIGETSFFAEVKIKYPEFQAKFDKYLEKRKPKNKDLMEFIIDNSPFLKKETNRWMVSVINIIRNTALYFSPQSRTKIINEGWASYWHDELFRKDERIKGHEVDYAIINAGVTSLSRVGLNPYAIGLRLIQYVEDLADKGKLNFNFQKINNYEIIENYDLKTGTGKEAIFDLRTNFSDFMLLNTFITQEFVNLHNLFVVGQRINEQRGTVEYYIKSRNAQDYKSMLLDKLQHPPKITIDNNKTNEKNLYLVHKFEGKQLIKDYIPETMIGIEFLWGDQVQLETTEIYQIPPRSEDEEPKYENRRVLYTVKNKKIKKEYI